MSTFQKRPRILYDSTSQTPFRISRTKIDSYMKCPFCFYIEVKFGVPQPPSFPFSLNSAVDKLLKKEFDIHRKKGDPHPLMEHYGIDAIPYPHAQLESWRDAMRAGIQFLHHPTNFLVTGGIDDVWVNPKNELHIVDYKATSKNSEVSLDAEWQIGYKRQMEVYQWLFKQNGFKVSEIGYFVYCNGRTDKEAFDAKLEFDIKILPYIGKDGWIEKTLLEMKDVLDANEAPAESPDCDYCAYRRSVQLLDLKPKQTPLLA